MRLPHPSHPIPHPLPLISPSSSSSSSISLSSFPQALYPVHTLMLTISYKTFPRFTFAYLYLFQYYEMFLPLVQLTLTPSDEQDQQVCSDPPPTPLSLSPSPYISLSPLSLFFSPSQPFIIFEPSLLQLLLVLVEVLVVPHVVVIMFSLRWVWTHPLICCMVWIHVSREGGREGGRAKGEREGKLLFCVLL